MSRVTLVVFALAVLAPRASATVHIMLWDSVDDFELVLAADEDERVQAFRDDLDLFNRWMVARKEPAIIALLGRPEDPRPTGKSYAMPVGRFYSVTMSGFGYPGRRHTDFHPVGDVGAIEVWYGLDGETPVAAVVYLTIDETFPKLTKDNLARRLAWDRRQFRKLVQIVADQRRGPATAEAAAVGAWATALDEFPEYLPSGPDPVIEDEIAGKPRPATRRWWMLLVGVLFLAGVGAWIRRTQATSRREPPSPG